MNGTSHFTLLLTLTSVTMVAGNDPLRTNALGFLPQWSIKMFIWLSQFITRLDLTLQWQVQSSGVAHMQIALIISATVLKNGPPLHAPLHTNSITLCVTRTIGKRPLWGQCHYTLYYQRAIFTGQLPIELSHRTNRQTNLLRLQSELIAAMHPAEGCSEAWRRIGQIKCKLCLEREGLIAKQVPNIGQHCLLAPIVLKSPIM